MNFNQYFMYHVDHIFFARSVYEQHHLCLSINFAMLKVKPCTITAGIIEKNFKGTIGRFAPSDNAFSFMSSVKQKQHNENNLYIIY